MNIKYVIRFFSPGTFINEQSDREINMVDYVMCDTTVAVTLARDIVERHGARPFGFQFIKMESDGWEPKVVERSPMYYLGGTVRTAEEVLAGTDPKEEILRSNVKSNNIKRIITNDNSWRFTAALNDDDIVLDVKL